MIIKFFSNFCDSATCKQTFEQICEAHLLPNYGVGKPLYITSGNDFTHAIILNTAMPRLNIPKTNVIGLAHEPIGFLRLTRQFIRYAQSHIGETYNLPKPFVKHYSYLWHITLLRYIPIKTDKMSIIFSEKQDAPGHKYRYELVDAILKTKLPIDIYGRGCKKYSSSSSVNEFSDSRIKGEFTDEKLPYEQYEFHIAIENCQTDIYISEKLTNALLCSSTPIYLGARECESLFPNMVIYLSGNVTNDMAIIQNIFDDPTRYAKTIDIDLVKSTTNLLKNL
jgi:hypothetical protein